MVDQAAPRLFSNTFSPFKPSMTTQVPLTTSNPLGAEAVDGNDASMPAYQVPYPKEDRKVALAPQRYA
jgi:hypothetical protein